MENCTQGEGLAVVVTQTTMVRMKKHHKYFYYKSLMMAHLAFASENVSMDDSLFHLFFYHVYKDKAQAVYFSMSHEEHKVLHELMVL